MKLEQRSKSYVFVKTPEPLKVVVNGNCPVRDLGKYNAEKSGMEFNLPNGNYEIVLIFSSTLVM
ncbi:hypothetical protein [Falsibacillus albus]|uniref:Uncharacterized protein n=1 Tax=Falsibacillus albus TaxID=2478915 RepID=A0A3L7JX08_9BACI|nr:hypothetical protein [Falsibacillus albus]RLQ94865.1 hypothetical protein D9X91_12830 [Falsibacillus albus]